MSDIVIVALITLVGTIVGNTIISVANSNSLYNKLDKQSEISDEKLKARMDVFQADLRTLSNRVDAHNKIVERTYSLERKTGMIEERIEGMNERMKILENDGK